MSLLIVEMVPQGIIFGADRNINIEAKGEPKHVDRDGGTSFYEEIHRHYSQEPRPKVLRWPKRKALLGYVGAAKIGGLHSDEWLYDFIGEHITFTDFASLVESLREQVEAQHRKDEGNDEPEPLIIHLGGFEDREGIQVPVVYVIRNAHATLGMEDWRKEFLAIECVKPLISSFEDKTGPLAPKDIRTFLQFLALDYNPLWFHQGFDLGTFNVLEGYLKAGLKHLVVNRPLHQRRVPTLADWEQQVRMSILMYGAYFQAYMKPYEQYVGGGADTVSIPWPE